MLHFDSHIRHINFNSGIFGITGNVANGTTTMSFNGGTLKNNNGGATLITIGTGIPINVQAGGGTIDTTGGFITSASSLSNTASPGALNLVGGNTLTVAVNATQTGPVNITGSGTKLALSGPAGAVYPNLWTLGAGTNLDVITTSATSPSRA